MTKTAYSYRAHAQLSNESKAKRKKLMHAMSFVIEAMKMNLYAGTHGKWDSASYAKSWHALQALHGSFLHNEQMFDATLSSFFADHPELCKEGGFLASEGLTRLGQFLSRGLPTLRVMFRSRHIILPPALELLHEKYHEPLLYLEAGAVPKQEWFSPIFGAYLSER